MFLLFESVSHDLTNGASELEAVPASASGHQHGFGPRRPVNDEVIVGRVGVEALSTSDDLATRHSWDALSKERHGLVLERLSA